MAIKRIYFMTVFTSIMVFCCLVTFSKVLSDTISTEDFSETSSFQQVWLDQPTLVYSSHEEEGFKISLLVDEKK